MFHFTNSVYRVYAVNSGKLCMCMFICHKYFEKYCDNLRV